MSADFIHHRTHPALLFRIRRWGLDPDRSNKTLCASCHLILRYFLAKYLQKKNQLAHWHNVARQRQIKLRARFRPDEG